MKKKLIIIALSSILLLSGCQNNKKDTETETETETITYTEEETTKITEGTLAERLRALPKVKELKATAQTKYFPMVYTLKYEQLIDHDHPEKGTFLQKIEFGFNDYDAPNTYVTEGYMMSGPYASYSGYQNEIAYLLKGNYVYVEHRYFGESLPKEINFDDASTWDYLSTYQAASDAHDIIRSFKRILNGKWVSTGASKGGMTTHMFNYYYPGDVDLYVPYVAPFCNSRSDKRMSKFIYEEAGDISYGEEKAANYRKEVLDFQIKLLEYRSVLQPRFFALADQYNSKFGEAATNDEIYDAAVMEFAIGFWQYYQRFSAVENCLKLPETSESEIKTKQDQCFNVFTSMMSPEDLAINNEYTPYYIQAYKELGNYGYDFSYIRNALTDKSLLKVEEDDADDLMFNIVLNNEQRKVAKDDLICPKINEMLKTTSSVFIIIYGSSDPWYSVRPDDVNDRDNINIFVHPERTHDAQISNFATSTKNTIMNIIKTTLGVE